MLQLGAPSLQHEANCSTSRNSRGGEGGLRRVWGTLASRGHWDRGCCWHMQAADGLGRPSGTPPGVGVGGSSASLNGRGCCESAGLDPPHRAETPKVQSPLASSFCLLMYLPTGTQPRCLSLAEAEGGDHCRVKPCPGK